MLIKLAALGAVGYAGYKYFNTTRAAQRRNAVAGGPLSGEARLQHSPDTPPGGRSQA